MEPGKNKNKLTFAVIGYGNIGRKHAELIAAHPYAQLIAIVDVSENARVAATEIFNIKVFSTIEELLQYQKPDVVNICTPNGYHIEMAIKFLEAGCHVILEKPIGLYEADCVKLIEKASKFGKSVFPVLQNRYSPPAKLLKNLLEHRKLGKVFWAEVHCYWNRDERYYTPGSWRGTKNLDGGTLYTQFSHFVDLLVWLLGNLQPQSAHFYNFRQGNKIDFEDSGVFHFNTEAGGAGLFSYSTAAYNRNVESSILLMGENGTVKASGQYMESITYFEVENMDFPVLAPSNPPNIYAGYQGSASNHIFMIDNVINALQGEKADIATVGEAMKSVALIEKVYNFGKGN